MIFAARADGRFPDRRSAVEMLHRLRRPFDVARVRLWLGEETGGDLLAAAREAFEALRAEPYPQRAASDV